MQFCGFQSRQLCKDTTPKVVVRAMNRTTATAGLMLQMLRPTRDRSTDLTKLIVDVSFRYSTEMECLSSDFGQYWLVDKLPCMRVFVIYIDTPAIKV